MDTDISHRIGADTGIEVGAIAVINVDIDTDVDVEVNLCADTDAALVIDAHMCRCRSILLAIY